MAASHDTVLGNEKSSLSSITKASSVSATESAPPRGKWLGKFKKAPKQHGEQKPKGPAKPTDDLDYSGVPPEQIPMLKAQTEVTPGKGSYLTLFKYATWKDTILILFGVFFAVIHGVSLPMFTLVMGGITNNFNSLLATKEVGPSSFQHTVDHNALYFVYIGIAIVVSAFLETAILVNRGEVLASRYRKAYMRAVIHQNIGYFDKIGSGEITTRITNDVTAIQEAISENLGNIISGVSAFVTAIVISLASQWKLALILLPGMLYMVGSMSFFSKFLIKYLVMSNVTYSKGSSVAEEALSAIRNTVAFGAQSKVAYKFDVFLKKTMGFENKQYNAQACMMAIMWSAIFWMYALAFWEGSRLIARGEVNVGRVLTVMIAMIMGTFQLGNVAPKAQFIVKGIAAGKSINEAIKRVSPIDSSSSEGVTLPLVEGKIQFEHVEFRYPSRPDVLVLPDFSLTVAPGETVALVGSSGSGKSTVVGLLERFYQPLSGSIRLDGTEIDTLNVRWLRQQIGLVSQEPTLFAVSIYENIAYGLIGTKFENEPEEVKRELVIEACKLANAYDFIQQMTDGLETNVGDRGFLMSGGQKQRIAIARAIVGNPRILLLDEATSALDTKSEGIVQDALDRAAKSRTTIVIAHRLSTIKDADKIVVMDKGIIVEQGTHAELLNRKGVYHNLVDAQQISQQISVQTEALEEQEGVQDTETARLSQVQSRKSGYNDGADVEDTGGNVKSVRLGKVAQVLWRMIKSDRGFFFLGLLGSLVLGLGYPALSMILGKTMSSLIVPRSMYHHMRHEVNMTSGLFFMVGGVEVISAFVMFKFFSMVGQRLLRTVRLKMFKQYLHMDVSFFDDEANSSGALTSDLASDGKAVGALGGDTFGQIFQSIVTLIACIAIAISFNWRLGLVGTACVPLIVGSGFFRFYTMMSLNQRTRTVYAASGSLAASYVSAVRTVQFLTREDDVCKAYNKAVDTQTVQSRVEQLKCAVLYGFAEGLTPWVLALIFWYGSTLLRTGKIHIFAYYTVFIAIVFGSMIAGIVFSHAESVGKGKNAAVSFVKLLEVKPKIDTWSDEGKRVTGAEVEGNVEFQNVYFRYPTRPQLTILRGLNLTIQKGQYAALVGPSGCGKSTTIGLLERFYDPERGSVCLDGQNITSLNVNDYRAQISLVQQEPMLYSGTIKENILFGWSGDEAEVTNQMIEDVCRKANIHDFIMSLPDGYETVVGSKGGMLSGGQKQRVAIARALIRNPKILLLDEATSALDSESEKVVQKALDEAAKGRTTIAVAHRLSTIQNADVIYVFDGGRVVEAGKHQELLALNGIYAELVKLQSLQT